MKRTTFIVVSIAGLLGGTPVFAGEPAPKTEYRVEGEKLDSGLGEIPVYTARELKPAATKKAAAPIRVPGEKLDSGLGSEPVYRAIKVALVEKVR